MASDNPLPSVVDDPVVTTSSTISLVDEPKTIKHKLRRIGKFRCMAVVAAVLFVLCVTFLVLYIVKKPKAPEKICDTMTCVYISEGEATLSYIFRFTFQWKLLVAHRSNICGDFRIQSLFVIAISFLLNMIPRRMIQRLKL